ncbi:small ribosomal subunit protein mS37 isoform X1 [Manis javanica]|uniref:small ribosomal subunit protein mS37 isoform X1 n=1 Tax=Manis javanica TaxID=9974 RepID=UPI003C6D79F3
MATPSLRGRLARLGNPRKPILKPNKPLILANRVGERRREKGEATCITEMSVMMACWKQNEFRDEACRKEIQEFFDCASRAEVTKDSSGALMGGEWGRRDTRSPKDEINPGDPGRVWAFAPQEVE